MCCSRLLARLDERNEGMARGPRFRHRSGAKRSRSVAGLNMVAVLTLAAALPLIALAPVASAVEVLPASGDLGCDDLRLHACEFFDPGSGLSVRLPRDWPLRRLRVRTETGPSAGVRQRYAE